MNMNLLFQRFRASHREMSTQQQMAINRQMTNSVTRNLSLPYHLIDPLMRQLKTTKPARSRVKRAGISCERLDLK